MLGSLVTPPVAGSECRKFGLPGAAEPHNAEERLLARVVGDMCYVAGSLLHTAAKILNKALQLAGIPQGRPTVAWSISVVLSEAYLYMY